MPSTPIKARIWKALVLGVISSMAACGGDDGSDIPTPTLVISRGVMLKGSVIVNGIRYEDTTANISIDDKPKTAANLQTGMVVQVSGTINGDGTTGTASTVKALVEVRGTPTLVDPAANPRSLVVLGQTVLADDQTVYSNLPSGFGSITTSTLIEVHGLRDASNRIRASRIEANASQMGDSTADEIRGVVSGGSGSNPTTFNLGSQAVSANGATISPAGASYTNGSVVEVYCDARPCLLAGVFQASRIAVEGTGGSTIQPSAGQRYEVEGLVTGFTSHPDSFSVAGTLVTTSSTTRFTGGIATDLANDIKVEAEGVWNGSALVASKIEFKRSVIRLQGAVTAASTGTFTLSAAGRDISVETDSFTAGSIPPVSSNCVQVRGQRKAGGGIVVIAGEIATGCSNSGRHLIQAPVEAETPEQFITLLGFSIDVSAPTDTPNQWVDTSDNPISRTAFFNAVTPANPGPPAVAGTLVKVTFNNDDTARQAELED